VPTLPARHRAARRALPGPLRRAFGELGAAHRVAALVAVGALGTAGLSAAASPNPKAEVSTASVARSADRVAEAALGGPAVAAVAPTPAPHRAAAAPRHRTVRPGRHHVAARRAATVPGRWLPTGTGVWIYQWNHTSHGRARAVVGRARRYGITTLFVRTGSSHDGFTGSAVLRALLPATRGTAIHVVAWDFPELAHPEADARRLARAARTSFGGVRVAAVAPDIETGAEGTASSTARVRRYLVTLRRALPRGVAILATVPWPSGYRVGRFPYATVAAHSDALLPMAYWYDNSPATVTAASIRYLRRFHKPIQPVGQGYDGAIDVPSLPHNDLRRQVPIFFRTAHGLGVRAVSLWSWQAAPPVTWKALAAASRLFPSAR
jgi:hypothetical protein